MTAGNASGVNDGAAALMIASEAAVKKYGLTPIARILGGAAAGVGPGATDAKTVRTPRSDAATVRHHRIRRSVYLARHRRVAPARESRVPRRWCFANAGARLALATMCVGVGEGIAVALERV